MKDEKVFADAADLELQIDMLEEFDANSDDKYNTLMICWLKELQQRRALQSGNSAQPVTAPEKLPLDYLQGQKDGLEWAAQMAEASHPQTGDWLYDDPLELAKAIRKGPDMPNHDNTLVIPDGLIPAINRLLDSDGSRGCYDAMVRGNAREEIERLLAAAPKVTP